ncbi:uncharacterized protein LOC117102014 [Anneissia japonica]|uniref:uncharacterized protein LOC117102014 n=1 Tax=Anneissia japonica TaxID=1529436 RepID=UPI00142585DC|nr:uncharacterized protein LOC117102014 [Anneissia japonica]
MVYRGVRSLWKPKPYRLKVYEYGATMEYKPSLMERCRQYFIGESGKRKRLLSWTSSNLPTFCVDDFDNCWSDGVALCALIESVVPDTCPRYDLLDPKYRVNNCRLGMRLVAKTLGIVEPMTPTQMANPREIPDEVMVQYLQTIKYASKIPVKEPERIMLKLEETIQLNEKECTATGSGLVVAVEGKRAKFNIHTEAFVWKNIYVEITGTSGECCKRKINYAKVDRVQKSSRKILVEKDEPDKNNRLIHFDYDEIKEDEYQIIYTPCNSGQYEIAITWGGEHIKNSPFTVKVHEPRVNGSSKSEQGTKRVSFNTGNVARELQSHGLGTVKQGRRQSLFRQSHLDSDQFPTDQKGEHGDSVKTHFNRSGSIFGMSVKKSNGRRGKIIRKIIKCPSGNKEIRYSSPSLATQRSIASSKDSNDSIDVKPTTPNRYSGATAEELKVVRFADRLSKQLIGRVYYEITKEIIKVKARTSLNTTGNNSPAEIGLVNGQNLLEQKLGGNCKNNEHGKDIKSLDICNSQHAKDEQIHLRTKAKSDNHSCNHQSGNEDIALPPNQNKPTIATEKLDQRGSKPITEPAKKQKFSTDENNHLALQSQDMTCKPIHSTSIESPVSIGSLKESINFASNETNKSSSYDISLDSTMSVDDFYMKPSYYTKVSRPYRPTWQVHTIDRAHNDIVLADELVKTSKTEVNGTTHLRKNSFIKTNVSKTAPITNVSQSNIDNNSKIPNNCYLADTITADVKLETTSESEDIPTKKNPSNVSNEFQVPSNQTSSEFPKGFGVPLETGSDIRRNESDTFYGTYTDIARMENNPSPKHDDAITYRPIAQNSSKQETENNMHPTFMSGMRETPQDVRQSFKPLVLQNTRATQSTTRIIRRSNRNKPCHEKATQCTADSIRRATGWGLFPRSPQQSLENNENDKDIESKTETNSRDDLDKIQPQLCLPSIKGNTVDVQTTTHGNKEPGTEKMKRTRRPRFANRQGTFDSGFSDENALSGHSKSPDCVLLGQKDVSSTSHKSNTKDDPQTCYDVMRDSQKDISEWKSSLSKTSSQLTLEKINTSEKDQVIEPPLLDSTHNQIINENIKLIRPVNTGNVCIASHGSAMESVPQGISSKEEEVDIDAPILTNLSDRLSPNSVCSPLAGSSNDADMSNVDGDESSVDTDASSVLEKFPLETSHKSSPSDSFFLPAYPFQEWMKTINDMNDVTSHLHVMQPFGNGPHSQYSYSRSGSPHDRYRAVYDSDTMSCRSTNSFGNSWSHCPRLGHRCVCEESSSITSSDFSCSGRRCHGCKVFGVGIQNGYVNVKNNFQVETSNASRGGYLSVNIRGPRRHSVIEISVVFTGDDLYEVLYEVNMPGFYVISVKWSEQHVIDSPFIVGIK